MLLFQTNGDFYHGKVAEVLVGGKALRIEGGNIEMSDMRKFHCDNCGTTWEVPFSGGRPHECPSCQSTKIHRAVGQGSQARRDQGGRRGGGMGMGGRGGGATGFCICPKCGYRKAHGRGIPCQEERCPDCGGKLVREGSYHHEKIVEGQKKALQRKKEKGE